MVGLDGEKMSKSQGNLVLVSKLRAGGTAPDAIRLAILANHYRSDWSWTQELLEDAEHRLERWRRAVESAPAGSARPLLKELRAALSSDLDAPRAVAAVDAWASQALAAGAAAAEDGAAISDRDAVLVTDSLEALLGIEL